MELLGAGLFGQGIFWDPHTTLIWLLIVVGVMTVVMFVVLSVLVLRTRGPQGGEERGQTVQKNMPRPASEERETGGEEDLSPADGNSLRNRF